METQQNATGDRPRFISHADQKTVVCPLLPSLVLYVESADQIDIWRVLHGSQDIPAWLQEAA